MIIWVVSLCIVLSVVAFIVYDTVSCIIKGSDEAQNDSSVLALSNWAAYLSRIFAVLTATTFALCYEQSIIIPVKMLFVIGFLIGLLIIVILGFNGLHVFMKFGFGILLFLPFKELSNVGYKVPIRKLRSVKIFGVSAIISSTSILALIVPLYVASKIPEYRMTAVYIGQFLNFFGTIILVSILDPHLMRLRDKSKLTAVSTEVIFGRIVAVGSGFLGAAVITFAGLEP